MAQSNTEAARWYKRAAEQGREEAQFNLGNLFLMGVGVAHSDAEAVKWYRKSADLDFLEAQ